MDESCMAGRALVELARPYLDRNDRDGLAARLQERWSPECLSLLLDAEAPAIAAVAATSLGLIGGDADAPSLARLLHRDEGAVVLAAEDALWSIWFRTGGTLGRSVLVRIAQTIQRGDSEGVIPLLTELIRAQPTFAEAYHQRSAACFLEGDYLPSLRDARRAVELNPLHFGALANVGHCHAALGRYPEALESYRAVLRIHPRMHGIRAAIRAIREKLVLAEA
ncbi:MAG: tetratricopeptide repeat protein [Phycisphaerae bacterium]